MKVLAGKKLRYLLVFLLVLILGLVVNMPITQVFRVANVQPTFGFEGLVGNVLYGKMEQIDINGFQLENIDYNLQPLCLLKLSLCYRVNTNPGVELNVERNLFSPDIVVRDSQISLAESFFDRIPNLLIKPKGYITAEIQSIILSGNMLQDVNADIVWHEAGIQGEEQVLGDIKAKLTRVEQGINLEFTDSVGLLRPQGEIEVNQTGRYQVDLTILTDPGLKDGISNALELVARKTNLNEFSLKRQGQLTGQAKRLVTMLQRIKRIN
jgi:hypothetical protein